MPTYVLLSGFPEYAAANIADARTLYSALLDPATETNALTIGRITGRLAPLCIADTAVPLTVDSIDDVAGTRSSWVTNANATLAFAIGDADPARSHRYASANVSTISANTRIGNIVLRTSNLVSALSGEFGQPIRGTSSQFTAHIQQTDAQGFTQTYGLVPITIDAGVFDGSPVDQDFTQLSNFVAQAGASATAAASSATNANTYAFASLGYSTDSQNYANWSRANANISNANAWAAYNYAANANTSAGWANANAIAAAASAAAAAASAATVAGAQPLAAALTALAAGSDFVQFTGPATTTKVFTLPNASATILTDAAAVTGAQGGTGVANTGKTLTLGGSYTINGTDGSTLNISTGGTLGTAAFTAASAYQPLDSDLTAIAALTTTGIIARTAADTYSARTITGTAGNVTVTNGDGVSGAPTLSLPTALTSINSATAAASTDLTLTAGSGNQNVALTPTGTGSVLANGAYPQLTLGNATVAGAISLRRGTSGTASGFFGWLTAANDTTLLLSNTSGSGEIRLNSSSGQGFITFYTTTSGGTNAEASRITKDGNLLIGGTTDITGSGGLKVFGTTASTSTTTGTLVCAGGVGIAGALYGTTASFNNAVNIGSSVNGVTLTVNGVLKVQHNGTTEAALYLYDGSGSGRRNWGLFTSQSVEGDLKLKVSSASDIVPDTDVLNFLSTGAATFSSSITTAAPSGGTAAAWKLGTVASVSPTSPNRTIELDVGGTRYFIAAKTTND